MQPRRHLEQHSTAWRWPSPAEEREDYGFLRNGLPDDVARRIAAMPVVVLDHTPRIPFAIRADAWCWRASLLLNGFRP